VRRNRKEFIIFSLVLIKKNLMRKINIGEEQVAIYEAGDSIADILAIICP